MVVHQTQNSDDEFTPPGIVTLSAAALKFARDFDAAMKRTQRGEWIVSIDWATSVSVRLAPDAPWEEIGAGLSLGAYKRSEVPRGFTQTVEGVEFAIKIPRAVWEKSAERLIDIDEALLFKLALR